MNAVCVYDFTSFLEKKDDIITLLKQYCKHWVFQQEECPTTLKKHFQGRLSLKVKERISGAIKKFPGLHLTITSSENKDNDFYVTKEDTRIDGPWKDTDDALKKYIPRQIRDIVELYPWQNRVIEDAKIWNTRHINVIIDKTGNNGKSTLKTYIGCHGIGRSIPFTNDYKDIMRIVMDTKKMPLYIIDIPRALRKDQLFQFFSGIETLKDGYAYDDRYSFREEYFDCPNIWIFMNKMPELDYMSKDRWRFYEIQLGNLVSLEEVKIQAKQVSVVIYILTSWHNRHT